MARRAPRPTASGRRGRRRARLHRPARAPARARQRGRRDRRDRPGRGRPRRVHDGLRDAEHDAGARRAGRPRAGPGGGRRVRVAGRAARPRRGDGRAGRGDAGRAGRAGRRRGRRASPTTGRRSASAPILRTALAYAGALGLPIVDHPEDPSLTDGRRGERRVRRDRPRAARLAGRRRGDGRRAGPRDPRRRASATCPGARLHLTHVSTAGALELVRRAKAAGLPVTCDVTPHHLALTDEWIAGARRWAWDGERRSRGPTARSWPRRSTRRSA